MKVKIGDKVLVEVWRSYTNTSIIKTKVLALRASGDEALIAWEDGHTADSDIRAWWVSTNPNFDRSGFHSYGRILCKNHIRFERKE